MIYVFLVLALAAVSILYCCLVQLQEMNHKATILLQLNEKAARIELKVREAIEDLKNLNDMSSKICMQTKPLYDIVRIRFAGEINRSGKNGDKLTPPEN